MGWTTYEKEFRQVLRDNPKDRLRFNKKVFGVLNGTNKLFKTFEFQCVTDFSDPATLAPLGIFLNNVRLTDADVASHDLDVGAFELVVAPVDGDDLRCSYYVQFFTQSEAVNFIANGVKWLGFNVPDSITDGSDLAAEINLAPGLQAAAIEFAKGDAYAALALRYIERASETYQLEDMPAADRTEAFKAYTTLSKDAYKSATGKRDEFYTRQGQSLSPLFGVVHGRVGKIP